MIKEAYVSFEVAKLLKEKGFDIDCRMSYFNGLLVDYTMYGFCEGELINCPTHQMAMAWLREVKNLWCEISWEGSKNSWCSEVFDLISGQYVPHSICHNSNSYEEAVEEVLKYALTKLELD